MRAHLFAKGVRVRGAGVTVFDIELGPRAFVIKLEEAPTGVGWFAKGDAILAIEEAADGKSAKIIPTAVGTSVIHLEVERAGRHVLLKVLTITVYAEETTKVEAEFTNVRLKPKK